MKKYIKPELFYERYELSQHIADCAWEFTNHTKEHVCQANGDDSKGLGDDILFIDGIACTIDSGNYQNYCYQSGADGINCFVS